MQRFIPTPQRPRLLVLCLAVLPGMVAGEAAESDRGHPATDENTRPGDLLKEADGLELRFGYFPSAGKLRLLILRAAASFVRWEGRLSKPPSDATLAEWKGSLPMPRAGVTLEVPALDDGAYALAVDLVSRDGTRRKIQRTFERKRFAWEGNPAGRDRSIIPPFTPLVVGEAAQTVSCVLRRHELGRTGLWHQVSSQDRPLLASPMRIEIEMAGKTHLAQGTELAFPEKAPDRVQGRAAWTAGPVQGRTEFHFEYDGMVKVSLHLAAAEVQVDRMHLVIPMRTDETWLMHPVTDLLRFHYAGRIPDGKGRLWDYGGERREVLYTETGRPDPDGKVWDSRHVGRHRLPGPFVPYIWLGGPERGLCWFAENDRDWSLDPSEPCLEIRKAGATTSLVVRLVTRPVVLKRPRTIEFGLMATPAKPMPEAPVPFRRWWTGVPGERMKDVVGVGFMGACYYWGAAGPHHGFYPAFKDFRIFEEFARLRDGGRADPGFIDMWLAPFTAPEFQPHLQTYRAHVSWSVNFFGGDAWRRPAPAGQSRYVIPYTNGRAINWGEEVRTFLDEWSTVDIADPGWPVEERFIRSPGGGYRLAAYGKVRVPDDTTGVAYAVDPVESWQDMVLHYTKRMLETFADGIYFDNYFLVPNYNPLGPGYMDDDGEPRPGVSIFGFHELTKRLAVMQHRMGRRPLVFLHMTNTNIVPMLSFGTLLLDHEWRDQGEFRDKDFQERLYLDDDASLLLAQSTGFQSGCIGVVHNLLRGEQNIRGALGVALVHEMKLDVNTLRLTQDVGGMLNDFGYGLDDCRLWRHWDDPQPTRTKGPSVKTLTLARAGRAMIVASSFGPTGEVRLDVDRRTLGLAGEVVARNAETGERLEQPAPGSFTLTVPRHDFRLIRIESAKAQAASGRLQAGEESSFAVPRMAVPPEIDGTIDPVEWREAVAASGVTDVGNDLLDPRPATFFLGWDAKNLYMACRVYLRGGYKPRNHGGRVAGGADAFDDGLECLFKPMGGNVSAQNHATEFKFNVSSLGHGGTYTRLVVGQIMSNWEPAFRTATRLTEPGTAPEGGKWWELETAFSLADFELVGDNRAGDRWKLMLGINHLPAAGWMQERLPCVGGYFTPDGKSVATLVEDTPAVKMIMDSPSNVASDGTANLQVKAYNPAKSAARVKLDLDVAGEIVRSETLELPAGGERTFAIHERLPAEVKAGRLMLKAASGDRTLLSYIAPFEIGAYNHRLQPVPDPDPNEFPFTLTFNPLRALLQISGDSYFLPVPDAALGLRYEVKHKETGKVIAAGHIPEARAWRFEDVLTLEDIVPGTYEATAPMMLKDGKTFGPRRGSFEKKDEAKTFAHWWGKDPGNAERVLPPFTAVAPKGDALTCWGREYTFDALGLPASVESQGEAVLAAPARMVVTVGGRETAIAAGKPKITEWKDWRVGFEGEAQGAGLTFSATGWMEQDGMVSVDLTYAPKDGKPTAIDALRIEYPVAGDVAECLVSVGPGANFAAMTATVLPPEKQGTLWTTFDTGRPGAQMRVGSFYPHAWLGNERRGFQWWADSDRGWFPHDAVPAHEVAREGRAVVLKNHIIGKSVVLTGPRALTFTWIASPFKPLAKGWRMIAATDDGTFAVPHRGTRVNPKTGKKYLEHGIANWINPESYDPAEWGALWAEQKEKADEIVRARRPFDLYGSRTGVSWQHMSFQLIGWGRKSMEDAVFDYFGDEWQDGGLDTWNPSYIDYAMYLFDRAFGEGGVVSTYWDLSFPILFHSPLSGLSYRLPDGRWQPGYNSLRCRRFFQRLWAVQDKHGLNPGAVGCHSTQAYLFPALPWIDAVLDGERDWNLDVSDMDWVDYYPKERMRAMSVPHTWGVGICWMSNFASADPKRRIAAKTSHAEYVWLHDSWINPYLDYGHVTRMPPSILDWGLNGADVVYVPYWRNPYAESGDADVLVSLWRIPGEADGRILAGVFNYDRRVAKDVEVKLDLARLGLAGGSLVLRDLSRDFLLGYTEPGIRAALDLTHPQLGSAAKLDAAKGILRIEGLGAHRGRYVGIAAPEAGEVERAAKALPAWVQGGLPAAVKDVGLVRNETRHFAPGETPGVRCAGAAIEVGMWQLPDRVLLAVYNGDEKAAQDAVIDVDLAALGLRQDLIWQEFVGVRQLHAEDKAPAPELDYYGGKLTLKAIPARRGRLVMIRKYGT